MLVLSWNDKKWNYLKYWFVFENLYWTLCCFPLKYPIWLIFLIKCRFYMIRNIMLYLYIVQVLYWRSFWKFYPELTQWLENFVPVSSTVPVYGFAVDCNRTLFAVEYKKLRIRHNVLYENICIYIYLYIYIAVVLKISFRLFAVIESRALMILLKGRYTNIFYLHNTCGLHMYI